MGTTIFAVMSKLAQECGAINLSQGFPDFPISEQLMDLVDKAMRAGHNQYAPMPGLPALREAIANKVQRLYGFQYDPKTEVTVTAGGTQAIFTALGAIVHPGDEVIIVDPAYDCYSPTVELFGGKPVHVRLGSDMKFDADAVKNAITKGEWVVRKVESVDEEARQVWFFAYGVVAGQDPYYEHLCRVNFDGSGFVVLTEGDGTHEIEFSPDRGFFIDQWSRVDSPPVHVLRRSDTGKLVSELETADASEKMEKGWMALPIMFVS